MFFVSRKREAFIKVFESWRSSLEVFNTKDAIFANVRKEMIA